jgi:hypothetical protein
MVRKFVFIPSVSFKRTVLNEYLGPVTPRNHTDHDSFCLNSCFFIAWSRIHQAMALRLSIPQTVFALVRLAFLPSMPFGS